MSDRFPTTQWSRVLAARDGSETDARAALETLCQTYWHPLFVFVCRQGYDSDEARDLVQAYFAELLEKKVLDDVQPDRGRFRSFLLASLKHFLSHERDKERALKRGGGTVTIPLDTATATIDPATLAGDQRTPEEIYERQWALTVLERSLARVRQEAHDAGRVPQFETLKPYLTGESARPSYRDVAQQLGMNEGGVRAAVLRLRKRFGKALRAEVAETVSDPAAIDDEIRRLLTVLRPWEGG